MRPSTRMSRVVELSRWWWAFLLRGFVAIAFGILAFAAPSIGGLILVYLFGAWALVEGITSLVTGIRRRATHRHWWLEVAEGILSGAAGVLAIAFPVFTAEILLLLIAAWAIVVGAFQVSWRSGCVTRCAASSGWGWPGSRRSCWASGCCSSRRSRR